MERLDKILSGAGYGRKEARECIRQGRVRLDGAVVTSPETKCPESAQVTVDGQSLTRGYTYLMLHKPAGVVSATRDDREQTVLDLLPPELRRRDLFPVGRLDKDVTGLLLLTDDGGLAHDLLSPRKHVDKTYALEVEGVLDRADAEALARGVTLADGTVCLPARLELTGRPNGGFLTIREGKYHQVKRMLASLGKPVTALKRVSMGAVALDETLLPGQWRPLTAREVSLLRGEDV